MPVRTIADLGEKEMIERHIRPLFNPEKDPNSVGDDCAAFEVPSGNLALASTDRVPADLLAFQHGLIDHSGLGRYLAVLNFSDIAACGGVPTGLLLNFGLPASLPVSSFESICKGVAEVCTSVQARVIGGDISLSSELSISATALGRVEKGCILRRSGARTGDSIFVSRAVGLTPVALAFCKAREDFRGMGSVDLDKLRAQFTALCPMIDLGRRLALSGECSSAMDNTDGICQSLSELARESSAKFVLQRELLDFPPIVHAYAQRVRTNVVSVALGPGADFSLVGTLRGEWTTERAREQFDGELTIIGRVTEGRGMFMAEDNRVEPLLIPGWNYFETTSVSALA